MPNEKVDLKAKAALAQSAGVDQALELLNQIKSGSEETIDKSKIEAMLQGEAASDQNVNCEKFTSAKKTYSTMQRRFDEASQEKQCYVCVAYTNELTSAKALSKSGVSAGKMV